MEQDREGEIVWGLGEGERKKKKVSLEKGTEEREVGQKGRKQKKKIRKKKIRERKSQAVADLVPDGTFVLSCLQVDWYFYGKAFATFGCACLFMDALCLSCFGEFPY